MNKHGPSPATDTGRLGICHLKRFWEKARMRKTGQLAPDALMEEWTMDNTLLAALGLGLEQTVLRIYNSDDDFPAFEDWVEATAAYLKDNDRIRNFNDLVQQQAAGQQTGDIEKVLSAEQERQWEEEGYVVLPGAVSREDCEATIELICSHIDIDRHEPDTWYRPHPDRKGIMVQLFQHPLLEKNRKTDIIRKAFEQLWGRKDIWFNTDCVGFNPPETSNWHFPSSRLHWDVSLKLPIPFGTQGILYLSDTAANQGAFTLVPGFHRRVEAWLASLPPGASPREQDIESLGPVPLAANAGDFIIWHHALPHGSSPNNASLPRYVQYINYAPIDREVQEEWI